jgi:hypothetical protein
VKKSPRLWNAEGPKNTFPELIVETIKIFQARGGPAFDGYTPRTSRTSSGPPFSGCGNCSASAGSLTIHLHTYRRVGVKLPQHSLPLHCCAAEKFNHSRSFFIAFSSKESFLFSFGIRGSFVNTVKSSTS